MNRIRIHVLPSSRGRLPPVPRAQEPLACAFTPRACSQPRLDGQDFCIKHILEDRTAPFKQCSYVSAKNGRRCPNAAPKTEKKDGTSLCAEHARRNALALQAQGRKPQAGAGGENLLWQLSAYARAEAGTQPAESSRSEATRILDEDSWSDGEQDPVTVEQTWRGDPDSEADSIDSDQEDPLKHAGVYTAEEVALIMREKLIRLQSLYIDQFKRLQHLLKEKKRRFLHSRKGEHEAIGSNLLTGAEGLLAKERESLKRLKCLRRYRQRYGVEALLHRQLRERRALASDGAAQQAHTTRSSQRCLAFVDDVRCSNQSLPMTRHCLTHICQDPSQALFRPCRGSEDVPCPRAVPLSLGAEPSCPLHLRLPPPMYVPEQGPGGAEELGAAPTELYLSAAELQPSESLPLEFSDDLDVVGDGLQCPPSPLLFDPSVALDPALRDVAEAAIDILGLEEPEERGSGFPPGPDLQVWTQSLGPPISCSWGCTIHGLCAPQSCIHGVPWLHGCSVPPLCCEGGAPIPLPPQALTEDLQFAVAAGFKQEPKGNCSRSVGAPSPWNCQFQQEQQQPVGVVRSHPRCSCTHPVPLASQQSPLAPEEAAASTELHGAANGNVGPGSGSAGT